MGIKFDIFANDCLLMEDSSFSKFFSSKEPIEIIHRELKVAHDTKLVLSPTDNRNLLEKELRKGKAIFAIVNKPEVIRHAKALLRQESSALEATGERSVKRTQNEIKDALAIFDGISEKTPIDSYAFKRIKKIALSLRTRVRETFGDAADSFTEALNDFIRDIRPGEYILVKRMTETNAGVLPRDHAALRRSTDRKFPEGEGKKAFGQKYIVYTFSSNQLITKKTEVENNAIRMFEDLFPGRGVRDFYIVDDENFLRAAAHPYNSSKSGETLDNIGARIKELDAKIAQAKRFDNPGEVQALTQQKRRLQRSQPRFAKSAGPAFAEILRIEKPEIKSFAINSLNRYQAIISNKIAETTERVKQRIITDMENENIPENEVITNLKEYRRALKLIKNGAEQIDPVAMFNKFISEDTSLDFNKYIFLGENIPSSRAEHTGDSYFRYTAEVGQKLLTRILSAARSSSELNSTVAQPIKVREKKNRDNIIDTTTVAFQPRGALNPATYEMYDVDRRRWVPVDTKYFSTFSQGHTNTSNTPIAIGFRNIRDYNEFVHKFVIFTMRNIISAPEVRDLENLLNGL